MAGDFSGEHRPFVAHAELDEGVPDAVHERNTARPLDRVADGPTRANVVDDLGAGLSLEDRFRQEGRHKVAGNELASVVDEETAVRVPVEGDPEVGLLREDLADDELAVLGEKRVRLVVRKRPVWLEEAAQRVDREAPQSE